MRKKIKTILDFGITEEEMLKFFGFVMDKEEYLKKVTEDTANKNIAMYFIYKNKRLKAWWYINKVKDPNIRNSFWRTVSHIK